MRPQLTESTRVLVLAVSVLERQALATALNGHVDWDLVGVFSAVSAALEKMRRTRVDVLLVSGHQLARANRTQLEVECRKRHIQVVVFEPSGSLGETIEDVLGELTVRNRLPGLDATNDGGKNVGVVAIGSSTGGPNALGELLPLLPREFGPPVLIAQHMPATFIPILARRLSERSQIQIHEAVHGEPLRPGCALLAPGDYHLEVEEDAKSVKIHQGPPENSCRPSVDVLFRSVARAFGPDSVAIVLTGMGRDGYEGARMLRGAGARVLVQDPTSSVVWGMPGLIAREGLASGTGTVEQIARWLVEHSQVRSQGLDPYGPSSARNP